MNEYVMFMYQDSPEPDAAVTPFQWQAYLSRLQREGVFDGGSSIGQGARFRKGQAVVATQVGSSGFIRIRGNSLEVAQAYLEGNPLYEAGGTVEIRELPHD